MNIEQAKQIPIHKLVEDLGGIKSHVDQHGNNWYFSPFRPKEKTASFKIDEKKNTWHDFGMSASFAQHKHGNGGDIIDLWCDYHFEDRRFGIKKALEGLSKYGSNVTDGKQLRRHQFKKKPFIKEKPPRYKIIKMTDRITAYGLKNELDRRKISLQIAELYLKQGVIEDTETKKKYNGFLFENDKGGYEVSVPNPMRQENFKTCIGPKAGSRFLTSNEQTKSADIFEGFWDFLTWLEIKGKILPINHSYILNSVSMVDDVCRKVMDFKDTIQYVFLYMDNDEAGFQATHAIALQLCENFNVGGLEHLYKGYKDLSDYWMNYKPG